MNYVWKLSCTIDYYVVIAKLTNIRVDKAEAYLKGFPGPIPPQMNPLLVARW